ncbi:transposase [Octadecabacter sp. R77987]|uniref:REP-associated tyrosine transposase n=1 Tax=Octadecabacter sp. R77987 TaxID=3093874 RepID=UPI003670154E
MSHYRRLYVPGATYFFTARLLDRRSDLLLREVGLLRNAVALTRKRWPFQIDAAAVLPDLVHMIWVMPADDADFSKRWRLLKSAFSRHVPPAANLPASYAARGEKGIWQRRFWEHMIRDAADLARHRRMIHAAPVTAGLVARPQDWPFSSVHRDGVTGRHALLA